jgi:flagellar motor switch protein FliG
MSKFNYLGTDKIAEVRMKLPQDAWERIKQIAVKEHRPAAAQLRIILNDFLTSYDQNNSD